MHTEEQDQETVPEDQVLVMFVYRTKTDLKVDIFPNLPKTFPSYPSERPGHLPGREAWMKPILETKSQDVSASAELDLSSILFFIFVSHKAPNFMELKY